MEDASLFSQLSLELLEGMPFVCCLKHGKHLRGVRREEKLLEDFPGFEFNYFQI